MHVQQPLKIFYIKKDINLLQERIIYVIDLPGIITYSRR